MFTNSLAQTLKTLAGYVLSFLLAPLLVSRLGLAAFGVWAVTGGMATYAGLADFGIVRSLSRFVALYDANNDQRRIAEATGLGLITVTALTPLLLFLAMATSPFLAHSLDVGSVETMRVVAISAVVILVANAYTQVIQAIPIGLRRMTAPSIAFAVGSLINFVLSVAALLLRPQLAFYAVANAVAAVLALILMVVVVARTLRGVSCCLPTRATSREILGFGMNNQVTWLADILNYQTDRIVIAFLIDVRTAAAYELAARVVQAVRAVALMTFSAMIPTATAELAGKTKSAASEFYFRYQSRCMALAFPVFVSASLTAPFLLHAWLGQAPPDSTAVLVALNLAFLVQVTTGVGTSIALAVGDARLVSSYAGLMAGLNVAATATAAPFFGLWGVLAGTVVAITVASAVFIVRFHRRLGEPLSEFWRAIRVPLVLSFALAAPFVLVSLRVGQLEARLASGMMAMAFVGLYVLVYGLIASRQGLLPTALNFSRLRRRPVALPGT